MKNRQSGFYRVQERLLPAEAEWEVALYTRYSEAKCEWRGVEFGSGEWSMIGQESVLYDDELALIDERPININAPNITSLETERMAWSLLTFPEATPISSLRKLEAEIKEIEADIIAGIKEPVEYADALMCLFDSAGRQGIAPEEIFAAFAYKLEKNKSRAWIKNPDNSYSHVKPSTDGL